jgi:hypothetical protein
MSEGENLWLSLGRGAKARPPVTIGNSFRNEQLK